MGKVFPIKVQTLEVISVQMDNLLNKICHISMAQSNIKKQRIKETEECKNTNKLKDIL